MSQPPPATAGPAAATAEGADSCPTPGRNPQDAVAVAGSTEGAEAAVATEGAGQQKWHKADDTLEFNPNNKSITCKQYTCTAVVWSTGTVRISTKAGRDDGHIVMCYEQLRKALQKYTSPQ
jgi:hypothetical protein